MNTFLNNYIKSNILWLPERIKIGSIYMTIIIYDKPYKSFTNWTKVYILINLYDNNDIKIYVLDYTTKTRTELYTYDINTNTLIANDLGDINYYDNLTEHDYNTISRYINNNKDFIDIVISLRNDMMRIHKGQQRFHKYFDVIKK